MRGIYPIRSRYTSNRLFYVVIGVFVCIQMYGVFWNETNLTLKIVEPEAPIGSLTPSHTIYSEPSHTRHSEPSFTNFAPSNDFPSVLLELNSKQTIRNGERFPLKFREESVVILVQVHKRVEDLKIMIDSMKQVSYINETLLIFSHDFYSPDVFQLVKSIDFCPVLQLFYPFSIQFYNESFPGDGKHDCPRNMQKSKALEVGCYNARYPDAYGHYREGPFTQIKHHWLWKQHFVFDRVRILRNFTGTVLRLDDDYYLSEDVIHVIRSLDVAKSTSCPDCLMYILGEHEKLKPRTYEIQSAEAEIVNYYAGVGRGMAFKRKFWEMFKSCASSFCDFDDYNWDFSLQNSALTCMKKFKVLKPKAGRIFHIGTCHGFHRNLRNCNKNKVKADIVATLTKNRDKLYPHTFKILPGKTYFRPKKIFGGWADPRDRALCFRMFFNSTEGRKTLIEIDASISLSNTSLVV